MLPQFVIVHVHVQLQCSYRIQQQERAVINFVYNFKLSGFFILFFPGSFFIFYFYFSGVFFPRSSIAILFYVISQHDRVTENVVVFPSTMPI